MQARCFHLLSCPVCGQPLAQAERALRCTNNHHFDLSREGYVNLLPGGRKRSRIEGDAKAMLRARRSFLDAGYYRPLARAIDDLVWEALAEAQEGTTPHTILDVGCGEGYYLGSVQRMLADRGDGQGACLLGIDLSKEAAKLAARRYDEAIFVVADVNEQVPVQDRSIGVLLNLFAPRNPAAFARLLAPGGLLLVAIPAPAHLAALRDRFDLLQIEADKRERVEAQLADDFLPLPERHVTFALQLDNATLVNLVQMTPNYWHLTDATREAIAATPHFHTQAAVTILPFRRRGQA